MSPTFQKAWYKRNKMELPPHLTGSVKQASKEVKPSERVKKLQTKSLQAYGATKGLKIGGEHGSEEMKDTIAPLTRDQHSKVQAAARAAKKMPLTKDQRMSAIAAAVRKTKEKHDVPTMEPDEGHDDLRDLHQSFHIRKGYNEEVEQIDEISRSMNKVIKKPDSTQLSKDIEEFMKSGGKVTVLKPQKAKFLPGTALASKHDTTVARASGSTNVRKSQIGKNLGLARAGLLKKALTMTSKEKFATEEFELDEASKAEAEKLLGGPVKTRTGNEPKGKLPLGFRQARNLARKAMKTGKTVTESTTEVNEMSSHGKALAKAIMAKQSKRPIAQMMGEAGDEPRHTADAGEYDYEGDMAKSQLKSIITNAQRLHDMLEDTTNLPEWVQSKITLAEDYVLTAANYMEGEMNEEALAELAASLDEEIELFEKAPPGSKYERMVKHIKKGYAKGGLTPQEKSIAYATAWKAYNKKNEETEIESEQIEEKYMGFKSVMAAAKKGGARDPAAVAASIGRKKYGKEKFQAMAAAGKRAANEETEIVAEAEGSVPETPKEKELAKHHGDPNKITYGDVIKARLKSAAAKKMGK